MALRIHQDLVPGRHLLRLPVRYRPGEYLLDRCAAQSSRGLLTQGCQGGEQAGRCLACLDRS